MANAQALEAKGREIIHFEIGEPDFDLREVLANDAGQRRGVTFSPEQVVIGPGTYPLMLAYANAGHP